MRRYQLILLIILALICSYALGYRHAIENYIEEEDQAYIDLTVSVETPTYEF